MWIKKASKKPILNKGTTINGICGTLVPQDPESEEELIAKKYKKKLDDHHHTCYMHGGINS